MGSQREVFDALAFTVGLFRHPLKNHGIDIVFGDDETAELARLLPPVASGNKIRKIFAVDRQSLRNLSEFAEANNLARDEAVERLLLHYRPIVEKNRCERYENQRKVENLWQEVRDGCPLRATGKATPS